VFGQELLTCTLKTPDATTAEGQAVMKEITAKVESFAKLIETQPATLA